MGKNGTYLSGYQEFMLEFIRTSGSGTMTRRVLNMMQEWFRWSELKKGVGFILEIIKLNSIEALWERSHLRMLPNEAFCCLILLQGAICRLAVNRAYSYGERKTFHYAMKILHMRELDIINPRS